MKRVFVSYVLALLLVLPGGVLHAQVSVQNASGRLFPDGLFDEKDWDSVEWLLVSHCNTVNPEYDLIYASDREAAMVVGLLYDVRYVYIGAMVVMDRMHPFPLTTIEFWLDDLKFYVGRNIFGDELFHWIKEDGEGVIAGVPPRSRIGMQKTEDLDPEDRFGLKGVTGYHIEIAVALTELEKVLGKTIETGTILSFAVGYCQPLEIEGAELRDGLIYYPNTWQAYDLCTYGMVVFN